MSVLQLAAIYAAIGLGAGGWALVRRGPLDALLMLLVWPLYAPFLLERVGAPDLSDARTRLVELDRLLAGLDLAAARRRHDELAASGTPAAVSAAARRVAAIERLAALRARTAARLDEVDALAAQDEVDDLVARLEATQEVLEEVDPVPR